MIHASQATIEKYEGQILDLKQIHISETRAKDSELVELQKQMEQSSHQHKALGDECSSYIDQTAQLRQRMVDLESQLQAKEAELAEQVSVGRNLMVQVEQEHMEKTKIQKDVKDFHESISTLKSNIDNLLAENKALKQKNKDVVAESQAVAADFKEELNQLKTNLNEQQSLITSLQQTKQDLLEKLNLD